MNNADMNDTLQAEIASLTRDLNPERDLWPGIEHSLQDQPKNLAPAWSIAVAVALFSILISWAVLSPEQQNAELHALLNDIRIEHEISRQALIDSYENRLPYYTDWNEQLQQLEEAEDAIFSALSEEPSNLELVGLLRQVQHKQLDLIEAVYSPQISSL